MKKVLIACAAIALIAGFTSCDKVCKCKVYALGVESSFEANLTELEEDYGIKVEKCNKANTVIEQGDTKWAGIECK